MVNSPPHLRIKSRECSLSTRASFSFVSFLVSLSPFLHLDSRTSLSFLSRGLPRYLNWIFSLMPEKLLYLGKISKCLQRFTNQPINQVITELTSCLTLKSDGMQSSKQRIVDIALFKWASKVIWNFICFQSHNKTKLKPNLIATSLEFSQAWSR